MSPAEFLSGMIARWPTKNGVLVDDISRFIVPLTDETRERLLRAIVERYDDTGYPKLATVKKIAETIRMDYGSTSLAQGSAEGGWNQLSRSYEAFLCKTCEGAYRVGTPGVYCPICGERRSGERLAQQGDPYNWVEESRQGQYRARDIIAARKASRSA